MDVSAQRQAIPAPLGSVEPHAGMLNIPPDGQLLYKMMTMENLLRSILSSYLHFNRVDRYADFPGADPHDGQQDGAELFSPSTPPKRRKICCCSTTRSNSGSDGIHAVGAVRGETIKHVLAPMAVSVDLTIPAQRLVIIGRLQCRRPTPGGPTIGGLHLTIT